MSAVTRYAVNLYIKFIIDLDAMNMFLFFFFGGLKVHHLLDGTPFSSTQRHGLISNALHIIWVRSQNCIIHLVDHWSGTHLFGVFFSPLLMQNLFVRKKKKGGCFWNGQPYRPLKIHARGARETPVIETCWHGNGSQKQLWGWALLGWVTYELSLTMRLRVARVRYMDTLSHSWKVC